MNYKSKYTSILGKIILTADEKALTGLYFEGQKFFNEDTLVEYKTTETSVIKETKQWLDLYFSGINPNFEPQISICGTSFQISVWKILRKIPYGKTVTYSDIAKEIARQRGIKRMSAKAVGNAVGHNKISLIIPCHRVIGAKGTLIGYSGGIERKRQLLLLENIDVIE